MSLDTSKLLRLFFVSLILLFAAIFADSNLYAWRHSADAESMGFAKLSLAAKEMINKHANGVVNRMDGSCISSFSSFRSYVLSTRPTWGRNATKDNPFPGVLPPGVYGKLSGKASNASDTLIWSTRIYAWSSGERYHIVLTCNGDEDKPNVAVAPTVNQIDN